jgi:YesN/AraC family two-component response regulator
MAGAVSGDWHLIRRLHNHPQLSQTPFILYQQEADGEVATGLTSLVVKPASSQALWEVIRPTVPQKTTGSVLIVDDDAKARQLAYETVSKGLPPGYTISTAEGGETGLAAMLADPPSLVILDLMMPDLDGFEVLDRMRADERTRQIPVVILSGRQLSLNDVKRLERHAAVTLQSKGILSEDEIIASLHRSLFGDDTLPPQTSALAKQAVAYMHQNYARPLARWKIAEGIGVSEDYLSRVFNRELGISPWDYLNRYRISQAKALLRLTHDSIGRVGRRVGFSDPAYFSRVFRRITGMSPRTYREHPDN